MLVFNPQRHTTEGLHFQLPKMKKLVLFLSIVSLGLTGMSQTKITPEEARSICAQQMAAFTRSVSSVYRKGMTVEQFQFALCGKAVPTTEGKNQIKVAHGFLMAGVTNEYIIKSYNGKEIAQSLNYLYNSHQRGFDSDGSELFGGKTGTANTELSRTAEGPCRWYQFWCLTQTFANWVVANWPVIKEIIITIAQILFP